MSGVVDVMIVDDESMIAELYEQILTLYGHRVVAIVGNGRLALDMLAKMQHLPDLVILDHRMPQMSGVDALPHIRRLAPKALIVFASADPSVEAAARSLGSASFLNKPFPMDQLLSEINRVVEGSGNFPVHVAGTTPA